MGSAIMLLYEVRYWPGSQNVLFGCELYTDVELDTAVAIPCDVREKSLMEKKNIFCCVVRYCLGDVTQDDL